MSLLLARGTGAPGGFDFAGRRQKHGESTETFVVDILKLELGDGFSTASLVDDDCSCFAYYIIIIDKRKN